jgi:hypothetical protein
MFEKLIKNGARYHSSNRTSLFSGGCSLPVFNEVKKNEYLYSFVQLTTEPRKLCATIDV